MISIRELNSNALHETNQPALCSISLRAIRDVQRVNARLKLLRTHATKCFNAMTQLLSKIESKKVHVVVVGIGYVGLPLVAEFARSGFRVTGLDQDPEK